MDKRSTIENLAQKQLAEYLAPFLIANWYNANGRLAKKERC